MVPTFLPPGFLASSPVPPRHRVLQVGRAPAGARVVSRALWDRARALAGVDTWERIEAPRMEQRSAAPSSSLVERAARWQQSEAPVSPTAQQASVRSFMRDGITPDNVDAVLRQARQLQRAARREAQQCDSQPGPPAALLDEIRSLGLPVAPDDGTADTRSVRDALVQRGVLRVGSKIYYMLMGVHGVVYAASTRQHRGKPILGRVYSSFLFDSYRRPYTFGRSADAIGRAWLRARDLEVSGQVNYFIGEKRALIDQCIELRLQSAADAQRPEMQQEIQASHALEAKLRREIDDVRVWLQDKITRDRGDLLAMRDHLTQALTPLQSRAYPTIDLFLNDAIAALVVELKRGCWPVSPGQTVFDVATTVLSESFAPIARASTADKLDHREIWPIEEVDSKRTQADYVMAVLVDNKAHQHQATAFNVQDLLPEELQDPAAPKRPGTKLAQLLRYTEEPVSLEAVRQAYADFNLAKLYFDERLQRHIAVPSNAVLARPPRTAQLEREAVEAARQRGLAAIRRSCVGAPPALVAMLQRQAVELAQRTELPLFANVPWRVDGAEAVQLRRPFCEFRSMPYRHGDRSGNCNSIAFALLDAAAEKEQALRGIPAPPFIAGKSWNRALGAYHRLQLPRPRVLTT